eukprot:45555-Eustigmatos_ZCMA.PRE.2
MPGPVHPTPLLPTMYLERWPLKLRTQLEVFLPPAGTRQLLDALIAPPEQSDQGHGRLFSYGLDLVRGQVTAAVRARSSLTTASPVSRVGIAHSVVGFNDAAGPEHRVGRTMEVPRDRLGHSLL